ncbi:MAG: choice-of-anchor B family protein [Planctomycetota bacterium]
MVPVVVAMGGSGLAAQSADNMVLDSHISLPPCSTGDVWGLGNYMLVARRHEGFAVVDVSDPQNPVMNTIHPPGYPVSLGSYGCGDIKSDGRYIYVSDEATGQGAFIYDAQPDPMNPTLVGSLGFPTSSVHNLWIDGDYLYTATGNEVWDVSDRTNPVYLTRVTTAFSHDIIVLDDIAYVSLWNSGFGIYDVSNPRLPRQLARKSYSRAFTHNMWPTDDRNYLFTTDETTDGHVLVWDISSYEVITQVGSYQAGPTGGVVHNVQVHGDLLFVTYYKEGLRVLDISDPPNPVEIAHYDTYAPTANGCFGGPYAGCWGVYPWDRTRIMVSDMDNGAYVLRLTAIDQSFSAASPTVAPGTTIDLSFSYQNDAAQPLGAFGVATLSGINGIPLVFSLLADARVLQPGESASFNLPIPVPAGFPLGWPVEFTGYTGIASPLIVSDTQQVTVTVQ